jgi:hypothetical protein
MPVPDFSPGEVLTAAAMDSIGLWKTGGATLSGTSIDIVGCFNSNYDSYQIQFSNTLVSSAAVVIRFQLLSGTTPANGANYTNQRSSQQAGSWALSGALNETSGYCCVVATDQSGGATLTIANPFLAQRTVAYGLGIYTSNIEGAYQEIMTTIHKLSNSYDGIRITSTSTMTRGTVKVYGMRN